MARLLRGPGFSTHVELWSWLIPMDELERNPNSSQTPGKKKPLKEDVDPASRPLIIFRGPPSTIRQHAPARLLSSGKTNVYPRSNHQRPRSPCQGKSPQAEKCGKHPRQQQRYNLGGTHTCAHLYLSEVRPPSLADFKEHHMCAICFGVKCHPVVYECGHSQCYVCVRVWLEKSWSCPECWKTMIRVPSRCYGEEHSIAADYLERGWVDKSQVSYDWLGLTFPTRLAVIEDPDSP
ncbi:hypothetical protein B0H15DRAFT_953915 [Mycena belliarum]|uniref:RING-type domain-containing protein n=1 Tax=Mycena belliarum TaxID=1033014 RepID=A0AAD6TVP4_9AGAR|nr:hypothetical protein B0H15DRAFT_953915 [Mycena belliae]